MLTRRDLLRAGAMAGLAGIAKPIFANVAEGPRIDHDLLARARAAMDRKRRFLTNTDIIGIADFSQASAEKRFYLVHIGNGRISRHHVAHGRGSDPTHSGYVEHFSNEPRSKASSAGSYVTGDFYFGKYGRSLRLQGLDPSNNNAEIRNIVVHAAPYAEPEMLDRYGKLGRSEGCFAFSQASHRFVMEQLGPGAMLYCGKS